MSRPLFRALFLAAALVAPAAAQAWESLSPPTMGASGYDADRDRIVHVGRDRRVHEWHYGRWFARPMTAPAAPSDLQLGSGYFLPMVHDPVLHRMVMVGKVAGGERLFAFDGENWTSIALPTLPLGPPVRALAYDRARSRLVMVAYTATCEFDGQSWTTTVALDTPGFETLVFDPLQQRLMGYGRDMHSLGQVSTYDGVAWTSTTMGVPPYRFGATLGFDPLANAMVLHGSVEAVLPPIDDDEWLSNGGQWTRIVGTGSNVSLRAHLMTTPIGLLRVEEDHIRQVSLRVGQTWLPLGTSVPPSSIAHLVADPVRGGVLAMDAHYDSAGTTLWRLDDRERVRSSFMPGRIDSMAFDPVRQVVVAMDLWSSTPGEWLWNGTSWSHTPFTSTPVPFREESLAVFDAARNEFLVFGGIPNWPYWWTNDLFSYSNGAWTWHAADPALQPRANPGMVYDPLLQRTLLVAGFGFDDTWSWDGTSWQQLPPAHAPFTGPTALVFDPVSQQPLAINLQTTNQRTLDSIGVFAHDGTNWNLVGMHQLPVPIEMLLLFNAAIVFNAAIEPGTNRILVNYYDGTFRLALNPAVVEQQGIGCGAPLRISARTFARVGEADAGIDLRGVPGGALLGLSLQSANVALGSGCALLLGNLDLAFVLGMNAGGFGSVTLPVPPAPALAGLTVFAQAAQLDPTSPIGIAVSGRLALTIGE